MVSMILYISCKGESERLREELSEQKKVFLEYVITIIDQLTDYHIRQNKTIQSLQVELRSAPKLEYVNRYGHHGDTHLS